MLGCMGWRPTRWQVLLVVPPKAMWIQQLAQWLALRRAWDEQAVSAGLATMIRTPIIVSWTVPMPTQFGT